MRMGEGCTECKTEATMTQVLSYSDNVEKYLEQISGVKQQILSHAALLKENIDKDTENLMEKIHADCEKPVEKAQIVLRLLQADIKEMKRNKTVGEVSHTNTLKDVNNYLDGVKTILNKMPMFVPIKHSNVGHIKFREEIGLMMKRNLSIVIVLVLTGLCMCVFLNYMNPPVNRTLWAVVLSVIFVGCIIKSNMYQ